MMVRCSALLCLQILVIIMVCLYYFVAAPIDWFSDAKNFFVDDIGNFTEDLKTQLTEKTFNYSEAVSTFLTDHKYVKDAKKSLANYTEAVNTFFTDDFDKYVKDAKKSLTNYTEAVNTFITDDMEKVAKEVKQSVTDHVANYSKSVETYYVNNLKNDVDNAASDLKWWFSINDLSFNSSTTLNSNSSNSSNIVDTTPDGTRVCVNWRRDHRFLCYLDILGIGALSFVAFFLSLPCILAELGFNIIGITAGSLAAIFQSKFGTPCCFRMPQSFAMLGFPWPVLCCFGTVGALLGWYIGYLTAPHCFRKECGFYGDF